ncbi:hypothetical protein ANN_03315 [Periplaneta americana]|uniref:Uncharacterized protein n=1 Tax=Periplaneta americana TaxID=6978 RepID=A0ABQ8U0E9_PERAM|nr:hypothetical protein ANN_03315 [Periplaneta americana]
MCDQEKRLNTVNIPLARASERAAAYTGVSVATIKNIRKELKIKNASGSQSPIKSPGKRRPRRKGTWILMILTCVSFVELCTSSIVLIR